jgi:hypothetical protein
MNKETLKMQKLAGIITESQYKQKLNEILNNDDLMYDRMLDMDQEQLVSSMLAFAEDNPEIKLVDYLNEEFGYDSEDEDFEDEE